jgi:uncharacterized protein (DUF302 family)
MQIEEPVMESAGPYTLTATTPLGFAQAVEQARSELAREGFGILCEIDVTATLHAKLGLDMEPYLILGACNPPLAHRALVAEPDLGALLPCNVVVRVAEGVTHVSAVDPARLLGVVGKPDLEQVASTVRERLVRVVDRIADPA